MDPCPTDCLDAVIARLSSLPRGCMSENQSWHLRDAIDSLRAAREEYCLKQHACGHCDEHCGDLNQP